MPWRLFSLRGDVERRGKKVRHSRKGCGALYVFMGGLLFFSFAFFFSFPQPSRQACRRARTNYLEAHELKEQEKWHLPHPCGPVSCGPAARPCSHSVRRTVWQCLHFDHRHSSSPQSSKRSRRNLDGWLAENHLLSFSTRTIRSPRAPWLKQHSKSKTTSGRRRMNTTGYEKGRAERRLEGSG